MPKSKRDEYPKDAFNRNLREMDLPEQNTTADQLLKQIPIVGLMRGLGQQAQIGQRVADPGLLHNTAGRGLETNVQRGGPFDKFGNEPGVQMMSEGGVAGEEKMEPAAPEKGASVEIPEDIREYVENAHKMKRESRPDDGWRITPMEKKESVAPYKRDEEDDDAPGESDIPNFAAGGMVSPFDVDAGDSDTVKMNGEGVSLPPPPPPAAVPATPPVAAPDPIVPRETIPAAPKAPVAAAPMPTDQDYMNKANKLLGLNPEEQAGFMKLLGNNAQKAQIGAGIAGIGDAIASGGTLGKVNPGALHAAEEQIQGRTREGIEGMQTIRGNQEKAMETADKLQARDPQSPLSKWAQKAYAPVGKKIGLNLDNASAALIGDVTGKGVEALNTEFQAQMKMMGLDLQKKQVEATIGNQKAERAATHEQHQIEATKTLADRGIVKRGLDSLTGNEATKNLERISKGQESAGPYGAQTVRDGKTYEWSPETGKYHLKR